jgi:hypothetical protein
MKNLIWLKVGLALALVWATAAGPAPSTRAQVTTAVRVLPAGGTYAVGSTRLVEVSVQNVVDLYGAEIHLSFEPERLRIIDPNPGTASIELTLSDDLLSPPWFDLSQASNLSGTVQYAVTQTGESQPVSGSGALFTFTVEMLSESMADLTITTLLLSTQDAEQIPAEGHSASYTIGTPFHQFVPLIRR